MSEPWEDKLMEKAREVHKRGWGSVKCTFTSNGQRRAFEKIVTDIDEDEKGKDES